MKKVNIFFDVDGTLRDNSKGYQVADSDGAEPNHDIVALLRILAKFKNVNIYIWSGGGATYAEEVARMFGVDKLVKGYASKNLIKDSAECRLSPQCTKYIVDGNCNHQKLKFEPDVKPDIAIDDIQDCELGIFNLIVREK